MLCVSWQISNFCHFLLLTEWIRRDQSLRSWMGRKSVSLLSIFIHGHKMNLVSHQNLLCQEAETGVAFCCMPLSMFRFYFYIFFARSSCHSTIDWLSLALARRRKPPFQLEWIAVGMGTKISSSIPGKAATEVQQHYFWHADAEELCASIRGPLKGVVMLGARAGRHWLSSLMDPARSCVA